MPGNQRFTLGTLRKIAEAAGFEEVRVEDISRNTRPLLWLFFAVAYVPYLIIRALGLQAYFVNAMAAVESYKGGMKGVYHYVVLTARKPSDSSTSQGINGVRRRLG